MKKILLMSLAIVLMASTGYSSEAAKNSEEDKRFGGSLVIAGKESPHHLDGDKSTMWGITEVMNNVYEGLFEFDENQKATPFLAKSYELINENRTYAVQLREGVLFHNGKELTSDDVKASFDRWVKNNGGGQIIGKHLESVVVTGPYSIEFTFDKPYAPFLNIMASEVASQKFTVKTSEIIEKYGDEIIREHIGTGAYKFVEFVPGQYIKLERNDNYVPNPGKSSLFAGKRVAYLDDITVKYVTDPMVRVAGMQTGEFHFAEEVPQDMYPMFASRPDITVVELVNDMMGMIAINSGRAPFNDILVRKALIASLDMEELGRIVIGDERFWTVDGGGSMFPEGSIWYSPESGKDVHNKPNLEKAKELLAQSGYDKTPIVIINSREDMVHNQASLGIKSQLEKVGFVVDVQLFDKATMFEQLKAKDPKWDLNFSTWMVVSPDPQVFGAWIGTNKWISNWDDVYSREMDEIFERMMVETNFDKRYQIVKEWNDTVWETLPIIKTINYTRVHLKSNKLQNYPDYCKQMYWNTWLEK